MYQINYIFKIHLMQMKACLEVLVGECSYSYTFDRRLVLLYLGKVVLFS